MKHLFSLNRVLNFGIVDRRKKLILEELYLHNRLIGLSHETGYLSQKKKEKKKRANRGNLVHHELFGKGRKEKLLKLES